MKVASESFFPYQFPSMFLSEHVCSGGGFRVFFSVSVFFRVSFLQRQFLSEHVCSGGGFRVSFLRRQFLSEHVCSGGGFRVSFLSCQFLSGDVHSGKSIPPVFLPRPKLPGNLCLMAPVSSLANERIHVPETGPLFLVSVHFPTFISVFSLIFPGAGCTLFSFIFF